MKNTTFSTLASMGLPNNNDIDRQDIIEMICENYRNQYFVLTDILSIIFDILFIVIF